MIPPLLRHRFGEFPPGDEFYLFLSEKLAKLSASEEVEVALPPG